MLMKFVKQLNQKLNWQRHTQHPDSKHTNPYVCLSAAGIKSTSDITCTAPACPIVSEKYNSYMILNNNNDKSVRDKKTLHVKVQGVQQLNVKTKSYKNILSDWLTYSCSVYLFIHPLNINLYCSFNV